MDIQLSQCSITLDIGIGVSISETHFHEMYLDLCIINDSSYNFGGVTICEHSVCNLNTI